MQVSRNIALPKNWNLGSGLWSVVRILLVLLIGWFLYQGFVTNRSLVIDFSAIKLQWTLSSVLSILIVLVLLPMNWLLEAKKWQIIANSKFNVGFALKGVLMGLSLDNVLPLGTGGISGRVSTVEKENRVKVIPGILAGQLIQSGVTLLFGLIGFYWVWLVVPEVFYWNSSYLYLIVGVGLVFAMSIIFFKRRIITFLKPLKSYSIRFWTYLMVLSSVRYIVFLTQLLLFISLFSPELSFGMAFGCATWVFAARTFMPKITNFERLGIRALAVIFFAEVFSLDPAGMLISVALLWLINLALPSLVGLYWLSTIRK